MCQCVLFRVKKNPHVPFVSVLKNIVTEIVGTYKMYVITPRDHMSHDLSYFSGPSTSGAEFHNDAHTEKQKKVNVSTELPRTDEHSQEEQICESRSSHRRNTGYSRGFAATCAVRSP